MTRPTTAERRQRPPANLNPARQPIHQGIAAAIAASRGVIAHPDRLAQLPPAPPKPATPTNATGGRTLSGAELDDAVEHLHWRGHDTSLIAAELGITPGTVVKSRQRRRLRAHNGGCVEGSPPMTQQPGPA